MFLRIILYGGYVGWYGMCLRGWMGISRRYVRGKAAFYTAGTVIVRAFIAGIFRDTLGAVADGTTEIQSSVPLVGGISRR